jgi:23S rRNA pseudouridine955/2504/2580 synthase
MQTIIINKNDQGQRLDSFIKKTYPKISLSLIYRYIRTKRIKVNGKKCELNYRLNLNDKIESYINDELLTKKTMKTDFLLAPSKIDVIYEDSNILIVNKPVGLVVHEDESNNADNLSNRIQHYLADKGE